jgi:hypothetical protein
LGLPSLRARSQRAIDELAAIMRARDLPPSARIAAINSILDRGLGKPMQPMQQQQLGADGQPISPGFVVNIAPYPDEPLPAAEAAAGTKDTHH